MRAGQSLGPVSAHSPAVQRAGAGARRRPLRPPHRQLARVNLLILDDWGPEPLTAEQRRDLLEIVDDRYNAGSLIITSQVPVDRWYEIIGDPTLADAILDRLVHTAHRIELKGGTRRKPQATSDTPDRREDSGQAIAMRNVTENRTMPRGRTPEGENAMSNAERQARYRARRAACRRSPRARAAPVIDAAVRGVGVMLSTNCWRSRPPTRTGSRHCRKVCAKAPPPTR